MTEYNHQAMIIGLTYMWDYESMVTVSIDEHPVYGTVLSSTTYDESELQDIVVDIKRVWKQLSPADQIILEVIFREGKSIKELSIMLDKKYDATQKQLYRIIEQLVNLIG
jgi:DNA-directed RNA polymerase specialized sigma24 family protein